MVDGRVYSIRDWKALCSEIMYRYLVDRFESLFDCIVLYVRLGPRSAGHEASINAVTRHLQ